LIEAFGKRFFLTNVGGNCQIRERDQGGAGTWGIIGTITSAIAYHGFHLLPNNGVPTLVVPYIQAGTSQWVAHSTDGASWTKVNVASGTIQGLYTIGGAAQHEDTLYWAYGIQTFGGSDARFINFLNLSQGTSGFTSNVANPDRGVGPRFHVHKNKLFMLHAYIPSSKYFGFYELVGSTWTLRHGFTSDALVDDVSIQPCMISDGDDIVVFFGTGNVERVYQIVTPHTDTTPTVNNITSPVLNGITYGAWGSSWPYVSLDPDPADPITYIFIAVGALFSSQSIGNYAPHTYNGTGAPLTPLGTGIARSTYSIVSSTEGGLDRIPSKGAARPEWDGLPVEVPGARKRFFRVYGTGSTINLKQFHSAGSEAPTTESTLTGVAVESGSPATTPTFNSGLNRIENLTPDDGVALYSLTHDTVADSFSSGDSLTIVLDIV
jgi:hypothetical protein